MCGITLLSSNKAIPAISIHFKTMLFHLTTLQIFCVVFVIALYPVHGRSYPEKERALQDILDGILDEQQRSSIKENVKRQLDLGDEDPSPESWTGRWFPERVTEKPLSSSIGEKDPSPESWTGRWFPERVTQKPITASNGDIDPSLENWTGRWFPEKVTEKPHPPSYGEIPPESWTGRWFPEKSLELPCVKEMKLSMWKMINSSCDDGKTNLTVDWSGSPINYTCFNPQRYFLPDYELPNLIVRSLIPKAYQAKHECMQYEIEYPTDLPTFGTHRPAWPRYGEYKFVPRQRWIHSLEHGAIVFLYHPCAHPQLVNELREIVTGCLFRHIITPYTLLPPERPFALLSWGWALLMSAPDEHGAVQFIREHALHGPEAISKDGQFSEGLIKPAAVVADLQDSTVCPQQLF